MTPERYARIKDLFNQVADLPEVERRKLLDRACHQDADLRQQVLSLVQHDDSQTIIASSDTTLADVAGKVASAPARRPMPKWMARISNLTKHLGARGHLALGALTACIVLTLLAHLGNSSLLYFQRELRREALNEIIDGKVLALEMWIEHEGSKVESWARSKALRRDISKLVELASGADADGVRASPLQADIRAELHTLAGRDLDFSIWDRRHFVIADTLGDHDRIGESATPWGASTLAFVFDGNTRFVACDQRNTITKLDPAIPSAPHMGTVAPIRDSNDAVVAALMVHDYESPEKSSRILRMVRLGKSGETYVFNRDGLMLSESRFESQLSDIGLVPLSAGSSSAREIHLRDPGGDLTAGFVPQESLATLPLTEMARRCTAGEDGDNLVGYRDYRGVQVVGAWRWLEDLGVGIATELDVNEAEPGLKALIWQSWIVLGLFATCLGVALFSYYSVARMRQQVGENRKLGQYTLEKQIGEGGMGKVFLARHDWLKQPTAVKLLKPELIDSQSTARFQREARLASQLEHHNTIRVYDYGNTPDGLFYFVMEFIDGFSLDELVELERSLSPQRTIYLLRQICCSLREAHDAGLVHRDIKPSNIMVCPRGGDFDVVKVLDFGLVKPIQSAKSDRITSTNLVAGTPQYMPPERLSDPENNDPRSDIYSLGAVVFFLLTGRDFIPGNNLAEFLVQVVSAPAARPSEFTDVEIPKELDQLVFRCLSKDPDGRPSSVAEIIDQLDAMPSTDKWTSATASAWWQKQSHKIHHIK